MHLQIHPIDSCLIVAYLLGMVALGLWIGRKNRNLADYALGGKDLPWWALLGSIVATETSTVTFLSIPGIAYAKEGNLCFLQLALGYILGRCLVAYVLLPAYFRGEMLTAYEVLEHRFGGATKRTASLLFLVARNLGDGLRLFLAAIALEKAIGVSMPVSIVLISVATIVYTFFGGMRSVVWNDCVQFVVYMAGGLVAFWIIVSELPTGWEQFQIYAVGHDKLTVLDFTWDLTQKYTFWAGLIGGTFLSFGTHGTDQMMVQRYLAARDQRDAARALIASGFVVLVQFVVFLLLGVALACFFEQFPPDVAIKKDDEAFATFIVGHMPTGLAGLTLAAVFAAAMSTLSSSLNSSATAAVNDFGPLLGTAEMSPERRVGVCRQLTILFGLTQVAVAVGAHYYSKSVVDDDKAITVVNDALAIAGFVAGILLGVFSLGVLTKWVRQRAALVGMLGGMAVVSYVKFGTDVAWPWLTVAGSVSTFAFGLLASLCEHFLRKQQT